MEKDLYDKNVLSLVEEKTSDGASAYANKSLIQLEMTLLEMAAVPQLCQGIIYMFPILVQDKYIVRYGILDI